MEFLPASHSHFPKRVNNLIHDCVERFARVNNDGVLWFLERCKLAFHQFFWEKMSCAVLEPVADGFRINIKVHKCQGRYMIS